MQISVTDGASLISNEAVIGLIVFIVFAVAAFIVYLFVPEDEYEVVKDDEGRATDLVSYHAPGFWRIVISALLLLVVGVGIFIGSVVHSEIVKHDERQAVADTINDAYGTDVTTTSDAMSYIVRCLVNGDVSEEPVYLGFAHGTDVYCMVTDIHLDGCSHVGEITVYERTENWVPAGFDVVDPGM